MHVHTHAVDRITKSSEPVQIRGGKKKKEEACHPRKGYVCVCVCVCVYVCTGARSVGELF